MDAVSAAAAVAGVTSFGLAICQGIVQYYSKFAGQFENIAHTIRSVENLAGILTYLDTQIERGTLSTYAAKPIERSLTDCRKGLDELEKELKTFKAHEAPSKPLDKVRRLGQRLAYPFRTSTLQTVVEIVRETRSNLELAILTLQLDISGDQFNSLTDRIADLDLGIRFVRDDVSTIRRSDAQERIHRWLSPPDCTLHHETACMKWQAGTNQWFFQNSRFGAWIEGRASTLWVHGFLGSGKTVLCSKIIAVISALCDHETDTFAMYYFDFNDETNKTDSRGFLLSIISQLSCHSPLADKTLENLWSNCLDGRQEPTIDRLLVCLKDIIAYFGAVYIIVDALDECKDRDGPNGFLYMVEVMKKWNINALHLLLLSRDETDIEIKLHETGFDSLLMDYAAIESDIRRWIRVNLTTDPELNRWPEGIKMDIEKDVAIAAGGMFRYAECQLIELRNCKKISHVRKALKDLPKTIFSYYDRALCQINHMHYNDVIAILRWLAFALRPMLLDELAEVLVMEYDDERLDFNIENRLQNPIEVRELCPALFALYKHTHEGHEIVLPSVMRPVDPTQTYVRIAHRSVKDYITSPDICLGQSKKYFMEANSSHSLIAEACLTYLFQLEMLGRLVITAQEEYPLLTYSAQYWPAHAKLAAEGEPHAGLTTNLDRMFKSSEPAFLHWLGVHDPDKRILTHWRHRNHEVEHGTPLYYAATLGLTDMVVSLSSDQHQINAVCGTYGTPLQSAAREGYVPIVGLLLENGAAANQEAGYYGTALQAAARDGYTDVVKILVEHGANINHNCGEYHNALQTASMNGHTAIVQYLIKRGADINATGGRYWTALQGAAAHNHPLVVKMLLDADADVNARGGQYNTAVQAAAYHGLVKIVELLTGEGADLNGTVGYSGSPVQAAAYRGHDAVVTCLLAAKVAINDRVGADENPLHAASFKGHASIVKTLLENNADAQLRAETGETSLHYAALGGNESVIKQLLKANVQAEVKDSHGWTALDILQAYKRLGAASDLLATQPGDAVNEKPSKLNPTRCMMPSEDAKLSISDDGLSVHAGTASIQHLKSGAQIRSNHPLVPGSKCTYFEMEILDGGREKYIILTKAWHDTDAWLGSTIGIGVCEQQRSAPRQTMPGWERGSWGYHGDDGYVHESTNGKPYGEKYGTRDVIGCGVDFDTGTLFFTKNGEHLGTAFSNIGGRLFAVVALRESTHHVKLNFGPEGFRFPINAAS